MVMEPKYYREEVIGQPQSSSESMTGCLGNKKYLFNPIKSGPSFPASYASSHLPHKVDPYDRCKMVK